MKYKLSISQSAPQIYLCMLHLEKGQSSIADHYWSNAASDIRIERLGNRPITRHTGWLHCVTFSPDGKHIASGSEDKTVRIWDMKDDKLVAVPFEGGTNFVRYTAFSSDGTHVTSGSDDETVITWSNVPGDASLRDCLPPELSSPSSKPSSSSSSICSTSITV